MKRELTSEQEELETYTNRIISDEEWKLLYNDGKGLKRRFNLSEGRRMSKLKTLKDIKFFDDHDNQVAKEYNDSVKNDLKQEAIKWVKEDIKLLEILREEVLRKIAIADIMRWMKRLNIEEKDLK